MVLMLNNDDISQLLNNMGECVRVLEEADQEWAEGDANTIPRIDFFAPSEKPKHYFDFGWMAAGSKKWQMFCFNLMADIYYFEGQGDIRTREKYCVQPGTYCGLVMLFSTKNAEPLAIINNGLIQHIRVGGQTGVAVNRLAKKEAHIIGMLGSGGMARSFAEAIKVVRDIRKIKVYSPTQTHRDLYAQEMSKKLGIEVAAVDEPLKAVRGADIVCTCTDAQSPIMFGDWLEPGMLVCSVKNEVDEGLINRCDLKVRLFTDNLKSTEDRGRYVIGYAYFAGSEEDFAEIRKRSEVSSTKYTRLLDIMVGKAAGRTSEDETIYVHGGGIESVGFVALAGLAYTEAIKLGIGRQLPLDWFLQNVRD